ncbi:MAG TPA: hypothetical protein VG387_03630 [Rhizomicrobium sp.]|jgi:hypothetical protein|nr:hypothetical protein [Rhizomicrobium sp.]
MRDDGAWFHYRHNMVGEARSGWNAIFPDKSPTIWPVRWQGWTMVLFAVFYGAAAVMLDRPPFRPAMLIAAPVLYVVLAVVGRLHAEEAPYRRHAKDDLRGD